MKKEACPGVLTRAALLVKSVERRDSIANTKTGGGDGLPCVLLRTVPEDNTRIGLVRDLARPVPDGFKVSWPVEETQSQLAGSRG
jgi:hypothetical protein